MSGHAFIKPGQVAPDLPPPDNCVRCGQPEAAHVSADTEARRIAAAAVLGDYQREVADFIARAHSPRPDSWTWAQRLAVEEQSLLSVLAPRLDGSVPVTPEPGQLAQIRLVLDQVLGDEYADRQYALEQIQEILRGDL